jgi:glucoside 3-dehydrogenase (cytochrome c) hitch-hiker subunit
VVGGAFIASSGVLAACRTEPRDATRVLSPGDQELFEEIADTQLPTTAAAPGAKAAGVGVAANLILSDCYGANAQHRVVRGLDAFRSACRSRTGKEFAQLARADREAFLREIDAEARRADEPKKAPAVPDSAPPSQVAEGSRALPDSTRPPSEPHYFGLIRELALGAYFSSEIGTTKALRYVAVPGRFVGCMTLEPGQRAWA